MKKRMLCWLLALVMVFSLLPAFGMTAMATDVPSTYLPAGVSISYSNVDSLDTSNSGYLNFKIKSKTATIEITNTGTGNATITFGYRSIYPSHFQLTVDGETKTVTSSFQTVTSRVLGQNESVKLLVTSDGDYNFSIQRPLTRSASSTPTPSPTPSDDPTPTPSGEPTPTPTTPSGDGSYTYTPAKSGLTVGDDIDLSQTYYVNINEGTSNPADWREVSITKDTYYTKVDHDNAAHNDYIQEVTKSDGIYGEADSLTGWTPITGDGMYYMKDAESAAVHNNFLQVQSLSGTLPYSSYSNKLIASKSGRPADGLVTGPSESIGGWDTGTTNAIVVDTNGNEHTVLYANKGSTFHYNMFVYYKDGDKIVYLTQGANESDGDSKYFSSYPDSPKSDTPTGVGKYYFTYNNTLGSYGGKGYYTGTYYKPNQHEGKIALYYVDNGTTYWLSRAGETTNAADRTTAKHDNHVVYTKPLYQLQTLQRATSFSYTGLETPVVSHLFGDTLTGLTLCTRTMSGDVPIPPDDGADAEMGTLVDTTNNFKGNLFIQKRLYRNDATGEYNIKLESWATGDMSTPTKGDPTDIVLVVDLSNSMWQSDTKDLLDENGQPMYRSTAVIRAISAFIDKLHEMDPNGETYRVSIVSFSGEPDKSGNAGYVYLFDGQNYYYSTSDINSHAASSLKPVDAAGVAALKQSIDTGVFKEPKGDNTYPVNGLDLAKTVLEKRTEYTDRPATVIMFTDGVPGTGTGRGYSKYADPAIESAYDLKHNYNATIYTVGLFNFNDENLMGHSRASASDYMGTIIDPGTYSVKEYMEAVSSKYPNAQTEVIPGYATPSGEQPARRPCNLTPENTDRQYYFNVNTKNGAVGIKTLVDAFTNIAKSIATTDVPVDNTSMLKDVINTNDFAYPSDWTGKVSAETVKAAAINSRKEIEWSTAADAKESISSDNISATGDTIEVRGFNYAAPGNFSTPAETLGGQQTLGKKLVVRIKGLMPKHGGEVYSNSDAGIFSLVKDENGNNTDQFEEYLSVESPFDFIDIRSYVVDFNTNMKFAQNGYLASDSDVHVSDITGRSGTENVLRGSNGVFAKVTNDIVYQLTARTLINSSANYTDYSFTDTDSALVFGQYYGADRAAADKTAPLETIQTLQRVNGEDPALQTVAKAWQVVNMIPASSIYYDDDLTGEPAVIGDGSGYNSAVAVTPDGEKTATWTFAFTGTGIDIYCTTDPDSGYAQAKLDGSTVQTIRNSTKDVTRYNIPTYSFRGLEYGQHSVTINILSSSHYKFDGVRVYGPIENQDTYQNTSEQYAAYINMRQALVNDNTSARVTKSLTDDQMDNNPTEAQKPIIGALFVDDSDKLALQKQATGKDAEGNDVLYWEVDENGEPRVDENGNKIPRMVDVYKDTFEAYKENSPKQEIYLKAPEGENGGQAIIFTLSEKAETAAKNGNLWIGLSAPDENANTGKVTLIEGTDTVDEQSITVTSGVDMYYPITEDMIGANRVVTITNTGSSMISVTNLKITGNQDIYDALYADVTPTPTPDAQGHTNSIDDNALAATLSVDDVISMVFEPMTMRSIKIAANNGVDPDLEAADPEPTEDPEPSPTAEPDPTPAPAETPAPTQAPNVHNIVKQIVSSFVSGLFRSISRLFGR